MRASKPSIKVAGSGSFLPGDPVPFDEIDTVLGKLTHAPKGIQDWMEKKKWIIKEMVGIDHYHYAIDPSTGEFTEDNISMSVKAAHNALEQADMSANEIELIVYGALYMHQMPSPSVRIQEALGIDHCAELSVHANCTSAYKAVLLAGELLQSGRYKTALVLSSNMPSSLLRAGFYNQALVKKEELFLRWYLCDGAGALVMQTAPKHTPGLFLEQTYMESIGGKKPSAMFTMYPGYHMNPKEVYAKGYHHLRQMFQKELQQHFHEEGGTVFYHGLKRMIDKYKIDVARLKYFQINMPSKHVVEFIMEECEKLGIQEKQIFTSIGNMGYSGPPAALISLDSIMKEKKLLSGDLILSFGTEVSKFMQGGFAMGYYS
ncbi:MAG: 3-oxoacyl-ACP synthase III family protein [Desulfobulbaceae bacterium]|nr:3-oxoacyl-ACP synthase III family protein [Desulfobulbaceae bacterium]